jgi:hypothetical protein
LVVLLGWGLGLSQSLRTTWVQKKHKYTFMPWLGYESTSPVSMH